jgi:hypothetical protein
MPQIEIWSRLPPSVRDHLVERMRDRNISLNDLNLPEGPWYKDFGSFKLCGQGGYPKTFLLSGQPAKGQRL